MRRPCRSGTTHAWLDRWGGIAPLFRRVHRVARVRGAAAGAADLFHEQGVDLAPLGVVIAAWPAARLVGEPIFGWLADRTARVPLMVVGLVRDRRLQRPAAGLHRAAGLPRPARGRRPGHGRLRPGCPRLPDRRDAARTTWRGIRPVRRGADGRVCCSGRRSVRSGRRGSAASPSCSSSARVAAVARGRPDRRCEPEEGRERTHPAPISGLDRVPARGTVDDRDDAGRSTSTPIAPRAPTARHRRACSNRGLIAALVINAGGYFAAGTYEVIWSLFLPAPRRRARPDRADVRDVRAAGAVALAVAGRLVDRRGSPHSSSSARSCRRSWASLTRGSRIRPGPSRSSSSRRPGSRCSTPPCTRWSPPTHHLAGRPPRRASSAPRGRSASSSPRSIAGVLAETNIVYPMYVFSAVLLVSLGVGLLIGGRRFERPTAGRRLSPAFDRIAAEP